MPQGDLQVRRSDDFPVLSAPTHQRVSRQANLGGQSLSNGLGRARGYLQLLADFLAGIERQELRDVALPRRQDGEYAGDDIGDCL